jgi:parallel beta-helix repeat protein
MYSKIVSGVPLVLLMISPLVFALRIQPAEAIGDIYIRADGSVDPSTVPLATADNVTYIFTDKINASFVIERSNIVIDGKGCTLAGSLYHTGFLLSGIDNVTIKNVNINSFSDGIDFESSNNNTISGNNIMNNSGGISFLDSSDNKVFGNNIAYNIEGLEFDGGSRNIIIGNNVTANRDGGMWIYAPFNNNIISGNNITANNAYGIRIDLSDLHSHPYDNIICHNNFDQNNHGGIQVLATSSTYYNNSWDDGYPSGGNYWSGYDGADSFSGRYQNETGADGTGDTPYVISENNVDHYPLMQLYISGLMVTDLNRDGIINIIDISIVANAFKSRPGSANWNAVADLNKDGIVNILDMSLVARDCGKAV